MKSTTTTLKVWRSTTALGGLSGSFMALRLLLNPVPFVELQWGEERDCTFVGK